MTGKPAPLGTANFGFLAKHDVQLMRLGALVVRSIETYLEPLDRLESEICSADTLIDHLENRVLKKAFRGELNHE